MFYHEKVFLVHVRSVVFCNSSCLRSRGGVTYAATTNRYVALVLDTSGSMSGTPASVQKEAAKEFCKRLVNAEGNNYVALVRFNSYASILCEFTDNLTSLDNYIDKLTASGGTNTNDALIKAGEVLDAVNVQGAIKNIVVCSDGLPEDGERNYTGQYTYQDHSYSYSYANVAYETAKKLKEKYKIFTLGFFHKLSGNNLEFCKRFMRDIASDNSYYEVTKVEDLVITFGEVADDVVTEDKNPIIIVPGCMGSKFFTSDKVFDIHTKAWDPVADLLHPILTVEDIALLNTHLGNDQVYVRPCENQNIDVTDSSNAGNSVVTYGREYGATEAYKALVDRLCEVYSANKGKYRPVYFFSYDWRKSNVESAKKLDEAIKMVLKETGSEKVNLVCHSMGGLVASKYFVESGDKGQVDIIITCGTPYEGSPTLINSVMNWDVLGKGANPFDGNTWKDLVLGLFGRMNKKLKASFTGVAELLPTENDIKTDRSRNRQ